MLVGPFTLQLLKVQGFQCIEVALIRSLSYELHSLSVHRDYGLGKSSVVRWVDLQPVEPLVLKANLHAYLSKQNHTKMSISIFTPSVKMCILDFEVLNGNFQTGSIAGGQGSSQSE